MLKSDVDSIRLAVEVSGWDANDAFFVEHSLLDCFAAGQKTLSLRHEVKNHSVIFIRSIYPESLTKSYPEAHHVEMIDSRSEPGYYRLHLVDFPPRRNSSYEPKTSTGHRIDVWEEVKS